MESMRDINRVMEREIAKGSCPLKLDHIEFGDYSYQEITSKEKLLEVLSYLLLNTDVIHKRGLKRFVEDNIGSDEIKINGENIGEHSIFYYYILYKFGESEIQTLDDKVVEQFIINLFNTRKIDSREVNMREKLEEMLREEKYSELIKLGACKIRNW